MRVLLTGATGFVGSHLYPALEAAGCEVICGTRDPDAGRQREPGRVWVALDVEKPESVRQALEGCDAAFYLIHGMGQGVDYPQVEARSADNFVHGADAMGVGRIVYLGGVLPAGEQPSKHLSSRQRTGEILRSGRASALELRAAMIIGDGSASWTMVRDLAARLPAMILPKWLRNHSYPLAIDDVIWGLLAALFYPGKDSRVFELPGPERITHRDALRRIAALFGHTRPMINVPILSPRLSSYWIALVTRVDLELAKELVGGVRFDLEPQGEVLWHRVAHQPLVLEAAAKLALDVEGSKVIPSKVTEGRMREIGRALGEESPWRDHETR